jgi:hypothetical protein
MQEVGDDRYLLCGLFPTIGCKGIDATLAHDATLEAMTLSHLQQY